MITIRTLLIAAALIATPAMVVCEAPAQPESWAVVPPTKQHDQKNILASIYKIASDKSEHLSPDVLKIIVDYGQGSVKKCLSQEALVQPTQQCSDTLIAYAKLYEAYRLAKQSKDIKELLKHHAIIAGDAEQGNEQRENR